MAQEVLQTQKRRASDTQVRTLYFLLVAFHLLFLPINKEMEQSLAEHRLPISFPQSETCTKSDEKKFAPKVGTLTTLLIIPYQELEYNRRSYREQIHQNLIKLMELPIPIFSEKFQAKILTLYCKISKTGLNSCVKVKTKREPGFLKQEKVKGRYDEIYSSIRESGRDQTLQRIGGLRSTLKRK